ncbi:unnamed protein product, partial [Mesorhabditis spiculigera]
MTPVVYDLTGKCQVMEWGQDATELLGLPRDHYSVHISDRVGVLIDFEDPTAPKGLRMHLWVEQVGCVLPPSQPYDIHKMVAAPVDQLGLKTLIKVNEHLTRHHCTDVIKMKIKKTVCLRVPLIMATEREIEVLQVIVKGDSEFDWPGGSRRLQKTVRPEAPIANRFGFPVESRVRQIYVPDRDGPPDECVIYFILDATPDRKTIKVGYVSNKWLNLM